MEPPLIGPFPLPAGQTCEDAARYCDQLGLPLGGCSSLFFSCKAPGSTPPQRETKGEAFPWIMVAVGLGLGGLAVYALTR